MPKVTETTELDEIVHILMERRQDLVDQLAEIDSTFVKHGIPVPDQTGAVSAATSSSLSEVAAAPAARRGRPAGSKNRKKTTRKKTSKKSTKKSGGRGRGAFELSGEDSVLAFVKSAGNPSTKEVNEYWTAEGRGGKADNTLTKLVKEGRLKRVKAKDVRGSRYKVA